VEILSNLAELSDERLAEYGTEVRAAFDALIAEENPTAEQITEAESLAEAIDAVQVEQDGRVAAAEENSNRMAALRSRFAEDQAEAEDETETTEVDSAEDQPEPAEAEAAVETTAATATSTGSTSVVRTLSTRVSRPPAPERNRARPISITAAADVPEFATGSEITDLDTVSRALVNRMRGFGTPSGDGKTESLQHFGVANFRLDFPSELTIDRHSDDMEVLTLASKESRLPGNSLTAAGGWCAPSETIYDLCTGETAEGILSVPEVNVARGGIKYTSGPDFSTIYSNVGFCQTEAQAIAGTAKTCFEVPCPSFVEVRLDACGLCIKAPILTNAAYPELVQRWLSGSLIAHQHKMNAKVIAAIVAAAGASKTVTAAGTTTMDTAGSLELIADGIRSKYRLSMGASMEVVLPWWAKGAIRLDLSNRMNVAPEAVTDAMITAHFSVRSLQVSFVYDWQDSPFPAGTAPAIAYPANVQALIYPAGTFVKGTSDIINLNAVYDAASLATNIYTALFFEQGILVAKLCYEAQLVTVPICNAGRVGTANFTCP
jgi:hypothetical protein